MYEAPGQPGPPSGHYNAPPPDSERPRRASSDTSGMAITALILGALSFAGLSLLGAIPAVILGHMARTEIQTSGGRMEGDGMALAGLILGYINIALHLLACLVGILFFVIIGLLAV